MKSLKEIQSETSKDKEVRQQERAYRSNKKQWDADIQKTKERIEDLETERDEEYHKENAQCTEIMEIDNKISALKLGLKRALEMYSLRFPEGDTSSDRS